MAANNSYEEAVALIASANRVVQDPNSVGAALRTISLRLRGTSTKELEEAGEDTSGAITSKSKLRSKIQGYSGVDILTDTGAYKSTYEILLEISKVWDDMTDMNRAGLLEILAGKTRSNTAAAILSNTKDLEEAYASALDAEGSALRENEVYLNSIQGRIDRLTNAVQTMWNTELESGVVKFFVDLGTGLIKIVDNLGLINTLVFGLMGYLTIFKKNKLDLASMLGIHDIEKGWFPKKNSNQDMPVVPTTTFVPTTGEQLDIFSDEMQTQAQLNDKIKQLNVAKAELKSLKTTKWKDIQISADALEYTTSNRRRTYVNEVLIPNKQAEIVAIQKDIDDIARAAELKIEQAQIKIKEHDDGQLAWDFDDVQKTSSKYLGIFENGLGQGATEKLTYDTQQLGIELDKLNGMDNAGIVNYMQNLDSLSDVGEDTRLVLAGYAATVEDGNYTLQGAQKYVKNYNQSLAAMSKEATIAQFKQNMLNLAISAMAMAISAVITWGINQLTKIQDKFDRLSSEIASTASELKSLESELDRINDQIKELQAQGTLSFTDQEDLERLKAESAELERQIDLKETLQKQQQKEMNATALDAANDYYRKTGKNTGKTTGEIAGQGAQYGAMAGGAIAAAGGGAALTSAAVSAGIITAGTALAGPLGTVLASLLIAGVTAAVGAGIGAGLGVAEEKVGTSLDNMQEKYAELQKKYAEAQGKYENTLKDKDYDKAQKAQEQLIEYEANMAKYLSEMNAYYSQMDWETATTEQRKAMQEFYDTQDKWAIQSGSQDAQVNAISRIFGENASNNLQRIQREMMAAAKAGKDINLEDYFDTADLDVFISRIREMGLYVYEVENYFKDMAEAEEEASKVSLYEVATDINKITDGLENLKSAFEEIIEYGFVTSNTLTEMQEDFGGLGDVWDAYADTVFSGTSSIEAMTQATEELAEAFIDQKIIQGDLTKEQKWTYIIQLQNLGVENAEEYVNDKLAENMYDEIASTVNLDAYLDGRYRSTDEARAQVADIVEKYGIDIENEQLRENLRLLNEKVKAEQSVEDIKKQQQEYDGWYVNYQRYQEDLTAYQDIIDQYGQLADEVGAFNHQDWQYYEDRGSAGYRNKTTGTTMSLGAYQALQKDAKKYNEYVALKQKYDELWADGVQKDYIVDGKVVNPDFQKQLDEAQGKVDDFTEQLETELTADIQLKLDLQNASKLVDDIQSVYDSLMNAASEYNENGYFSVDTLQSLLELEPQYLTMLINEQGQLDFNKQAILNVAQARLYDMTQKQIDSIITNASNAAKAGEISKLQELTTSLYEAASAQETFNTSALAGLRLNLANEELGLSQTEQQEYYDSIVNQVNATIAAYENTVANLPKALSSSGGSKTSGDPDENAALKAIQDKYERQITNRENQQTEMENEMEILEAKAQGVSYSYYEALVDREQKKLDVYRQEWEALQGLELTDEVAEEIWAVEHAIQESTLAIINYRKEIVGLFTDAFDELSSVYDNEINITDNKKAYLEGYAELLELNDELPTVGLYEEMIKRTEENLQANFDKFTEQDALAKSLREQVNPFKKGTEEYEAWEHERNKALVEMQAQAAETKLAYQENQKEIAQLKQDIEDLYITAWDKVREAFNNKGSLFENQLSYIDEYINALETMNINVPDAAYQSQIDVQKLLHGNTAKDLAQARGELENLRTQLGEDDEQYIEKLLEVTELEIKERQDYNKILELEQQIIDNQLERFNQVIDRINHATSTLQNISDLIADEDVSTEDGVWTDEGMTRLGLAVQQMEMNKQTAAEYAQEIKDLDRLYRAGKISEKKYTEELQNLENGQWDAIKSYEDAKDAIVDIHEARVDMIEEGINKEIEAYQELIEVKKEELDAERDLYGFRNNIKKQTKDISQLERRIAALSGSDNAADIAERRKLEAELYEAKEGLNDTYYDHAKDAQSQALDDEMEAFEESKNNYVEKLREALEDTEALVQQTYTSVLDNGQIVLQTLDTLVAEYGVTITPQLTAPWQNAKGDADRFKNAVTEHINAIKLLVDSTTSPLIAKLTDPYIKAKNESVLFGTTAIGAINSVLTHAQTQQQAIKDTLSKPWLDAKLAVDQYESYATRANASLLTDAQQKAAAIAAELKAAYNTSSYQGSGSGGNGNTGGGANLAPLVVDKTANVKALQEVLNAVFGTNISVDGQFGTKTKMALMAAQSKMGIKVDGIYGPATYQAILKYIDNAIVAARNFSSSMAGQGVRVLQTARNKVPPTLYAKGTTGTTQDQWAITDEPWLGDELTMYATKQGTLSYMRAGSTVIPADLTKELMTIGEIGLDGLANMPKFDSGINLMSNVINKPELNLSFEALVKADKITEDTLPEVKKFVTQELNNFAKKLNYSLKKVGAY